MEGENLHEIVPIYAGPSGTTHSDHDEATATLAQVPRMPLHHPPRPGIPPAQPPKGPKHNRQKPGERPPHPHRAKSKHTATKRKRSQTKKVYEVEGECRSPHALITQNVHQT
jgi:hypothetical protein